jgi:hypothetical protein
MATAAKSEKRAMVNFMLLLLLLLLSEMESRSTGDRKVM